jgi:hypothetical protein
VAVDCCRNDIYIVGLCLLLRCRCVFLLLMCGGCFVVVVCVCVCVVVFFFLHTVLYLYYCSRPSTSVVLYCTLTVFGHKLTGPSSKYQDSTYLEVNFSL